LLKVALTHDVDRIKKTYQYLTHALSNLKNGKWNNSFYQLFSIFQKETYFNFPLLIEDEKKLGVKSTFFFLHETLKFDLFSINNWHLSLGRYSLQENKIREVILWLDKNGWEIGLHGSYMSYNNYELMKSEKQLMESILNHSVTGIRQHHLQMCNETWTIQKQCGFHYDSSFGFNFEIGFKDNRYRHFSPFNDNFMVFPMVVMDNPFHDLTNKWFELQKLIEVCVKKNALLVINWHTDHYHPKEFPGFRDDYLRIIEECQKDSNKFYTLQEYYNEITEREK
jgi:hypothetical protein